MAILVVTTHPLPCKAQSPTVKVNPYQDNIGAAQSESSYTLGPGDLVRIDIFDAPDVKLEERYRVLVDGSLNLPWVGPISVQGLTLEQATDLLTLKYSRFIKKPIITLSSISPRPLKVSVLGEVNRPGAYIISQIGSETSQSSLSQRTVIESGTQWPTVTKAIQTAGGITQLANVRKIQVHRPQRFGPEQIIDVDLWKFLQAGEQSQDLALRDGDSIIIPLANNLDPAEATQIATSNFSPETIKVSVVGEVVTPGLVTVLPNASLNQAVLAAGGFKTNRAKKKDVELIRLNPNGTVSRRHIAVDFSQNLDETKNPALRSNDIIVVNPNTLAKASDFLTGVFGPLGGVFGLFNLLGL
ncbi:MAG: polysaccharide biosynthesis/export family protein [Kovacikia sp.]